VVGPGLYTVENSLENPVVIKNSVGNGSYFMYWQGKISKWYQTFALQNNRRNGLGISKLEVSPGPAAYTKHIDYNGNLDIQD